MDLSSFREETEKRNYFTVEIREPEIHEIKKLEDSFSNLNVSVCRKNPNWYYTFYVLNYTRNLKEDLELNPDEYGFGNLAKFSNVIDLVKLIATNCENLSIMPV